VDVGGVAHGEVLLANIGNTSMTVGSITVAASVAANSSEFSLSNPCPASLGAGKSCVISLTFTGVNVGSAAGTLTINDSSTGRPAFLPRVSVLLQPASLALIEASYNSSTSILRGTWLNSVLQFPQFGGLD
jgi:hypothetical protein